VRPGWHCEPRRHRARGFTLIDVLVLIVLLGTVAGSMTVLFSRLAEQSATTLRARQSLGLAQALLGEVRSMPFTYCDPQDARATLATGAFTGGTGCATTVDALGPEPGETRYNPANRFDGVSDYQGLVMPGPGCAGGVCDIAGNLINGPGTPLAGCSARIILTPQALPGVAALDGNGRPQALRIVVTVSCPGQADTLVEAVRVRHAPRQI
jgi:MSHA pilin protein MshD